MTGNGEKMSEDIAEDRENGKFGQEAGHTGKIIEGNRKATEETPDLKRMSIRLAAGPGLTCKDMSEYRGLLVIGLG